jgi:hypothetical protein
MSHAALVSEVLFWFVLFLALLLVLFLYAVITAPPRDVVPAEELDLSPAALAALTDPPPAPAPTMLAQPPAPVFPAAAAGQPDTGYEARHAPAGVAISRPVRPSGPPPRPALASILGAAGLVIAGAGGWLVLRAGGTAARCPHHAVAVCLQGFVLFNATQLLGGAIAVAGVALVFTALFLALR